MLLGISLLVFGFVLLIWSASKFTENSIKIANIFQISPLVVGLLVFGFGTSAPELLISSIASFLGNTDLAIGNAVGSNIINIAVVLGICAVITPIKVKTSILKIEWLLLMFATVLLYILLLDNHISFIDGVILLLFLPILLGISIKKSNNENTIIDIPQFNQTADKTYIVCLKLLLALVLLLLGAQMVVWGGSKAAIILGVPDLIIGLTLVAFGTSLPELSLSIAAAIKKQHDMIIGNIIGSNIFNTLAITAMPGIINSNYIDASIVSRDLIVVFILSILLFLLAYKMSKQHIIGRIEGVILLLVAIYYFSLLTY